MKGLIDFVRLNHFETPVMLEMKVEKITNDGTTRYIRVKIQGVDVGGLVAIATDKRVSRARKTRGCVIVHGCGMDMLLELQMRVHNKASMLGYPNMFHKDRYKQLME